MPLPVKLEAVQKLTAAGDERARRIYQTIGIFFGYNIAHYTDFYEVRNLLVLGRVLTGEGGDLILSVARQVLRGGVPGSGRTNSFSYSRREGKAARAGHCGRQSAGDSSSGEIAMKFHNSTADFFVPDGAERIGCPFPHHAPVHLGAPGRYRDHGVSRCGRMLRAEGQVVHRRGGDQRRRQPAQRHLRRLHRRGDAEGAADRAAQGRLRGRLRLPDSARLHQFSR